MDKIKWIVCRKKAIEEVEVEGVELGDIPSVQEAVSGDKTGPVKGLQLNYRS